MFKSFFAVFSFFIVATAILSCGKDSSSVCVPGTRAQESASIQTYLTAHSLTATQDTTGLFYTITNPGSGSTAGLTNVITATYVGKLEDGTTFDSSTAANPYFGQLQSAIPGWQVGIPKIKKGGSITLYIPPSLGYACAAQTGIPANSNLIFTVTVTNIQ